LRLGETSVETLEAPVPDNAVQPICGVIRPIAEIDGLSPTHWEDVGKIISSAAASAGYTARLVSDASYSGVILKNIVSNLYNDPIVICDVSGKNPNVMFELGLRLAFDKPTIIVKDDKTSYSFDTSPIKHIEYPRDLRYYQMIEFQHKIKLSMIETMREFNANTEYSTFLKHFGEFKVAVLNQKEVPFEAFITEQIDDLRSMMLKSIMRIPSKAQVSVEERPHIRPEELIFGKDQSSFVSKFQHWLESIPGILQTLAEGTPDGSIRLKVLIEGMSFSSINDLHGRYVKFISQ
jgi:hypothetical protein